MVYFGPYDKRPCCVECELLIHQLNALNSLPSQVATSYSNSAAKAFGKDKVKPSAERYEAASEYMDICYSLWEKSWEDEAPA